MFNDQIYFRCVNIATGLLMQIAHIHQRFTIAKQVQLYASASSTVLSPMQNISSHSVSLCRFIKKYCPISVKIQVNIVTITSSLSLQQLLFLNKWAFGSKITVTAATTEFSQAVYFCAFSECRFWRSRMRFSNCWTKTRASILGKGVFCRNCYAPENKPLQCFGIWINSKKNRESAPLFRLENSLKISPINDTLDACILNNVVSKKAASGERVRF